MTIKPSSAVNPYDPLWQRVAEPLLQRFETAWRQGTPAALADILAEAPVEVRSRLALELASIDLEYRLQAGQPASASDYRTYLTDETAAEQLRTTEDQLRRRFGLANIETIMQTVVMDPDSIRTPPFVHFFPGPESLSPFAGYELLGILGRGGMGIVYKARQLSLNRIVAVKVVSADCQSVEARERFLAEASLIARLQHPGIVQIHDYGTHEGQPYFVMEFVPGGTLTQKAAHTPQPPREASRFVEQLARALDYSHLQGVIHRDLKPDNVLLGPDGAPKLADFGLAKLADSNRTIAGAVLGTPSYMSPEQAAGDIQLIDARTDVYSLGAVLYELLTGRPPFKGATPLETLQQVRERDPVTPRLLQPKVPRDLETICLKCLEKDPKRRYASACDLADDLRRFLDGDPIRARRAPFWERGLKWAKRRPAAAALLLSLIVGFAGMLGLWLHAEEERGAAVNAQTDADRRKREADEQRQLAEERLLRLQAANGVRHLDEGDLFGSLAWFVKVLELEKDHPEQVASDRLRIGALLRPCPRLVQLWFHDSAVKSLAFSPDSRFVVTACLDGTARVWNTATGERVATLKHDKEVVHAVFSPDGGRILTASWDQTARLWNAMNGQQLAVFPHENQVDFAAFSPNGGRILTVSNSRVHIWEENSRKPLVTFNHDDDVVYAAFQANGQRVLTVSAKIVRIWDARGKAEPLAFVHPEEVLHAAFRPDGKAIVTACKDGAARLWDTTDPQAPPLLLYHHGHVLKAEFSPDGEHVVTASSDRTARVWETQTGRPVTPPLPHKKEVRQAAFSLDGRLVVTASQDGTARLWDAQTGQPVSPPLPHSSDVLQASFSPDSRWLATVGADRTVRLWEAAAGALALPPLRHTAPIRVADFSSDGRLVLTASLDQTACLWDASTGQLRKPVLHHEGGVAFAAFSHDSRRVVTVDYDNTATVWDTSEPRSDNRLVTQFQQHTQPVVRAAFSPDDRFIVTASGDRTAQVWEASTGRVVRRLEHKNFVLNAVFSPVSERGRPRFGQRVLTVSIDEPAVIWDIATGRRLATLPHRDSVYDAVFSPDGTLAVTASQDHTAALWRLDPEPTRLWSFPHADAVRRVRFSPDGGWVATASVDQTARIWDVKTGEAVSPPLQHANEVLYVAFSPNSRLVVTASKDATARVWDAATGLPITPPLKHQRSVGYAAFDPSGRRVVTASDDGTACVWALAADDRPVADLVRCVQLLTGRKLDEKGEVQELTREELATAWQRLRTAYPDEFTPRRHAVTFQSRDR